MNEITSFGEWVKQRRRLLDLTQTQLAQRVGCAAITLKKIERDERRPSQHMAELLAEHLAVPHAQRARFLSLARGQFVSATPAPDALRLPPYLAAPAAHAPTPFVARQRELARLHTHLDRALAGHSQIVFVSGESGRGKTTLLAEFTRQALQHHADLLAVSGLCSTQGDIGDPYLPFRDALALLTGDLATHLAAGVVLHEQARRLWEFLPQTLRTLVDHGPSLLTTLVSGPALAQRVAQYTRDRPDWLAALQELNDRQQAGAGTLEQSQIFEQLRQLLQALANQRPILLVLDDLHWIDTASLNLLFHLGRRLERSRIMLLCAYRGSEVDHAHPLTPVIAEFMRRFGEIRIDLEQYDPVESRHFVDALLDIESNRLGEDFRARLFQHTKGYPLFTVELLRHLQERGDLIRDQDGHWIESIAVEEGHLPARIEAVINQRLTRIDAALQELLRVAAVEGEVFSAQTAARILQLDDRVILQYLSRLEHDHRLVREHSEIGLESRYLNRYQFSHTLFQSYLYRRLSQGEQRVLHGSVAEALAHLYQHHTAEIAVQLAHHYGQAGAQTQAAAYHCIAGDQAMNGAALDEASHHYRAALAGWPTGDDAGRAATLRKLGECLWRMGQLAAALEPLETCYDVYAKLGDRIEAGSIRRVIGRIYWESGQRTVAQQHVRQALHILEQEPESVALAQAVSAISQMHMLASEYEQAVAWGERALALAQRLGSREVIVHASNNIGVALAASTNPERGLALLQDSLEQARALNMPHDTCRAYLNLGVTSIWLGRYGEAETIFHNLFSYATQTGMALFRGVALVRLSELEWWQGRWASALARSHAVDDWRIEFHGASVAMMWAVALAGLIHNDLGRPDIAYQELEAGFSTARALDEAQSTMPYLTQSIRALAALGRQTECAGLIQNILALQKRMPFGHACSISLLLTLLHWSTQHRDHPESAEITATCLHHLARADVQFQSRESKAALAEAQGLVAVQQEEFALAITHFHQAAAHWEQINRPYDYARVRNDLGRSLLQTGDIQQAHAVFAQAHDVMVALAAQLDEPELRSSLLNSPLVQSIRAGQSQSLLAHA